MPLSVCVCVYTCIYIRYMQPCMLACIHNRSDSVQYLRAHTHTNTHTHTQVERQDYGRAAELKAKLKAVLEDE